MVFDPPVSYRRAPSGRSPSSGPGGRTRREAGKGGLGAGPLRYFVPVWAALGCSPFQAMPIQRSWRQSERRGTCAGQVPLHKIGGEQAPSQMWKLVAGVGRGTADELGGASARAVLLGWFFAFEGDVLPLHLLTTDERFTTHPRGVEQSSQTVSS